MNKKKIIGICVVIFVIVFVAICIAIVQFSKKDLEEAKTKTNSGKTANNGKGISIGYIENDESYQYQVLRLYK